MANSQQGPKFDLRGAQFAGGMAKTVQGDQTGGDINNYGVRLEDVTRLLSILRKQVQSFPPEYEEQKDEALDLINDLDADLKKPNADSGRIGRRLKRLATIASMIVSITGNTATFSGDLKDITGHVTELTEILELPMEEWR